MGDLVRTRIAPSPTGKLHVGTARAALFSELFARHHGGQFIVRIEDTDQVRSKPEFEQNILEGLKWLGLTWDEGPDKGGEHGPYRQSERKAIYAAAITQLLESKAAYRVEGSEAIRLVVPPEPITFTDLVRGEVTVQPETWGGDFIIARSASDPVFHLAVVIDDHAMKISHVIRGEDHLVNTARHILIQRALGVPTPLYGHLPLLLDEQRRKLSKRAGDTDLLAYRDQGIMPAAMLNYLALLGWNPKTTQEIFSHEELVACFDVAGVQKGGAIFSRIKLNSVNRSYIRTQTPDKLLQTATPFLLAANYDLSDQAYWQQAVALEQDRIDTVQELPELLTYLQPTWEGEYDGKLLIWKKSDQAKTLELLVAAKEFLGTIALADFTAKNLEEKMLAWVDSNVLGRADVLWPMRVALTGRDKSPNQFDVAGVLGPATTLKRIDTAIAKLNLGISP